MWLKHYKKLKNDWIKHVEPLQEQADVQASTQRWLFKQLQKTDHCYSYIICVHYRIICGRKNLRIHLCDQWRIPSCHGSYRVHCLICLHVVCQKETYPKNELRLSSNVTYRSTWKFIYYLGTCNFPLLLSYHENYW